MNELIFIIEESLDGGYEAKAVGTSIFTQGDDISDLKNKILDAVNCHFDKNEISRLLIK